MAAGNLLLQVGIFHVESHPDHKEFEQCVMFNSFPNKETELIYCISGFLGMYLVPFLAMVFCYGGIFVQLYCRRVRLRLSSTQPDSLTGEPVYRSRQSSLQKRVDGVLVIGGMHRVNPRPELSLLRGGLIPSSQHRLKWGSFDWAIWGNDW